MTSNVKREAAASCTERERYGIILTLLGLATTVRLRRGSRMESMKRQQDTGL